MVQSRISPDRVVPRPVSQKLGRPLNRAFFAPSVPQAPPPLTPPPLPAPRVPPGIPGMGRRRRLHDEGLLCSGLGKLTEALGISDQHNALPLDASPIALRARAGKADVVAGLRIGLTKAVELPWRYGLKGSKFLSKPF